MKERDRIKSASSTGTKPQSNHTNLASRVNTINNTIRMHTE